MVGNHSKVIRHGGDFTWAGVPIEPYKETTDLWAGITRRELAGKRAASPPRFHVRYFEIAPGGYSTLEKHEHEHVVIPIRGRGEAQFGCDDVYRVGFGDVVYIAPATRISSGSSTARPSPSASSASSTRSGTRRRRWMASAPASSAK